MKLVNKNYAVTADIAKSFINIRDTMVALISETETEEGFVHSVSSRHLLKSYYSGNHCKMEHEFYRIFRQLIIDGYSLSMLEEYFNELCEDQIPACEIKTYAKIIFDNFIWDFAIDKVILNINEDLESALYDCTDPKMDSPMDTLSHLPFNEFSFMTGCLDHIGYVQVRASREEDPYESLEVSFLLNDGNYVVSSFKLSGTTLQDVIKKAKRDIRLIRKDLSASDYQEVLGMQGSPAEIAEEMQKVFNLLYYLCTKKADIIPVNPFPIKRTGNGGAPKNLGTKVSYKGVGFRIGAELRVTRRYESRKASENGKGASKRPHIRRGHFHRYLCGPRDDPDKQYYRVVWIAPCVVNADKAADVDWAFREAV